MAAADDFTSQVSASLSRVASGWLIGTIMGLIVGCAMGVFSIARAGALPIVSGLYPIPMIAILPLLIVWLGIGESSKTAVIVLGVFSPTVISTFSAVDNVPRGLIRMGQSFGLSWRSTVFKIILPGSLPGVLAGFRITAAIALILLVSAEMIGAEYGIGALILLAGNLMQTDRLVAGVLLLSATGLVISWLLGRLEKALLKWR
jgi:ABC-type nitrate/sulfonate/bicarbonate transport system permease component